VQNITQERKLERRRIQNWTLYIWLLEEIKAEVKRLEDVAQQLVKTKPDKFG